MKSWSRFVMNHNSNQLEIFIRIVITAIVIIQTTAEFCDTETGQSNLIVDIEESKNQQINQTTRPKLLPIAGNEEITLDIASSTRPVFTIVGKQLQLISPLDRDNDDISSVILQVSCTVKETGRRRNIPVIVRISDVNDNAPVFSSHFYSVTVPEDLPKGGTVFRDISAKDSDAGINALVEYKVVPGRNFTVDGYQIFDFKSPHQPILILKRELDYETTPTYLVTIVASDRALNPGERLSSTATLTVHLTDVDDHEPVFRYAGCDVNVRGSCNSPNYFSMIPSGVISGTLKLEPDRIHAVDVDSRRAPIRYSFVDGTPSQFRDYFEINPVSALIRQTRPVNRTEVDKFTIVVKAEEQTDKRRSSNALLNIAVQTPDLHAPRIISDSFDGIVEENSAIGTIVTSLRRRGQPLQLQVIDDDLGGDHPLPNFKIELTTTTFRVNDAGILEVATDDLDRDPPNPGTLTFQAIARQVNGTAVSSPVSISVRLIDVNDNIPKILPPKPVALIAGNSKRVVTQIQARDDDWDDNGRLEYSIVNASGDGQSKFIIDPKTGVIDTVAAVYPGEKYSLTVEVRDGGGRSSQGIVEIVIVPGPNTRPPIFLRESYEIAVSEGTPINNAISVIQAKDPENEPVTYSIIAGNELGHFRIIPTNGTLLVWGPIDREELSRYTLTVKAEDSGGLFSSIKVHIRVTDINDRNPEFVDLPYIFHVKENDITRYIGRVYAKDADTEENGRVSYSVPIDSNFLIDSQTGEIKSKQSLDYEREKVHHVVVTAYDGGTESRLATATVTIIVMDIPDESPKFIQTKYEVQVPENHIDFFVVQVQAEDKDTQPSITYMIKQGDTDKFQIDPKSGVIRTKRQLDYERQSQYILLIGTQENSNPNDPAATATVIIRVLDRNDIAPIFTTVPKPVRVQSSVPIGHVVTTVVAVDSDGTQPNNQLRYELTGVGKATKYFRIDPETGVIQTKDDLRKDYEREYKVDIRAYDLGKPPLSSVATVIIYIDHVAPSIPDTGISFSDVFYTASVAEDSFINTLIKNLSIVNKPNEVIPISCEIVTGNEDEIFYIKDANERNCELRLKRQLDYEKKQSYSVTVQLKTLNTFLSTEKATARVDITVLDVNDNSPKFLFKYPENRYTNEKYYAAISVDAPIASMLTQVQAEDMDSGPLGQLVYEVLEETNVGKLFTVEPSTGILRTHKMIDSVQVHPMVPFRLTIKVRDNPGQPKGYREATAQVIVNILDQQHRLVLVLLKTPPDQAQRYQTELLEILQDQMRVIVRIEKLQQRQYASQNGTIHLDPTGSELWFYCIDPATDMILPRNHSKVNSTVLMPDSIAHISNLLVNNLKLELSEIRAPLEYTTRPFIPSIYPLQAGQMWQGFPIALIAVAVLVFVLAFGGAVYVCVIWKKFKSIKKKRVHPFIIVPNYEPVVINPNPKEYETQILQLSVNGTGESDSSGDFKMDFNSRRNHAFQLDNGSYATHEIGSSSGRKSPRSSADSDIATLRVSSLAGQGRCEFQAPQFLKRDSPIPTSNPLYEGSDEDTCQFTSATNANVTFRSKLGRLGIPEASTEL